MANTPNPHSSFTDGQTRPELGSTGSPGWGAAAAIGFVAISVLFTVVWLRMPCRNFFSPDEGAKYLQMRGMEGNPFQPCQIIYPGAVKDPALFYYPARGELAVRGFQLYPAVDSEGRIETHWLPWFPLITKPFFALLEHRGLYAVPLLAGLLALWLTGSLAAKLEPSARPLALAAFAMASPLLFYSLTLWEHTLALVFQLAALSCVLPKTEMEGKIGVAKVLRHIAAVALLVGAIALRREAVFFAVALGFALGFQNGTARLRQMIGRRKISSLCVGLVAIALAIASYRFVFPRRTSLDVLLAFYHASRLENWLYLDTHFFNVFFLWLYEDGGMPAALRWSGEAGLLACIVNFFWPQIRRLDVFCVSLLLVMRSALYLIITPLRYRSLHSLVLSAPFVLFSLLPEPTPRPRSPAERFVRTVALLFALIYLFITLPTHREQGGMEWGSRYALVLFSLLTAIGAVNVSRWFTSTSACGWKRLGMQGLVVLTLLLGAASGVRGILELRKTRNDLVNIESTLAGKPGPVVTDFLWLGSTVPDLFMKRELYTLASPGEISGWLDAIGKDEPSLVYASFAPLAENTMFRNEGRLEPVAHEFVCGMEITTYRILSAGR